ncbi:MAG: ribonuclease III, partial [Clostridia bacterium]|nr:ribonuclease III [Clostridia bacterium]
QAKALENIKPFLTDEEKEIVRRGRNAKPKHQAKNASQADYSYATAFEVLIGYLHLSGQSERLKEILQLSMKSIEKGK